MFLISKVSIALCFYNSKDRRLACEVPTLSGETVSPQIVGPQNIVFQFVDQGCWFALRIVGLQIGVLSVSSETSELQALMRVSRLAMRPDLRTKKRGRLKRGTRGEHTLHGGV